MKIDNFNQEEQPLFSRNHYKFTICYDKITPSNEDVKKELAKKSESNEDLIIINQIKNKNGLRESVVDAYIYKDAKSLAKYTITTGKQRKSVKEEAKKALEEHKEKKAAEVEAKKAEVEAKKAEEEAKKAAAEAPKEDAPAEKPAEEKKEAEE